MHAAGVQHEHQRKDRDNHVTVNLNNVQTGNADQFNIEQDTNDFSVPYDYRSVMHYGGTVSINFRASCIMCMKYLQNNWVAEAKCTCVKILHTNSY